MNITIPNLYDDLSNSITSLKSDKSSIRASRDIVEGALDRDEPMYGINTGFGALANKRVNDEQLTQLQKNLILSHSVGVGDLIPREISKLMLDLKIHALGLGNSGISEETFNRLVYFSEHDLIPAMPEKGSVGASGDLAPLAHMALPLLGYGLFWNEDGTDTISAETVLNEHNLDPVDLQPKDGLSLINGTQLMSGYGAYILENSLSLMKAADLIAAMSLEALQGSIKRLTSVFMKFVPIKDSRNGPECT